MGLAYFVKKRLDAFNDRFALIITGAVGSMWCAYVFAGIALISLPDALQAGRMATIQWIAQTFLQLVLLSVILVGQKVQASKAENRSDKREHFHRETLQKLDDLHVHLGIRSSYEQNRQEVG